jgi:hypothetical protein
LVHVHVCAVFIFVVIPWPFVTKSRLWSGHQGLDLLSLAQVRKSTAEKAAWAHLILLGHGRIDFTVNVKVVFRHGWSQMHGQDRVNFFVQGL